jgi:hypothetical protein
VVVRLLAAGADPNASVPERMPSGEVVHSTVLFVAVANNRLEAVRLLLDAGADPSLASSRGTTPLMLAAGEGQLEVLRLLLARGAAVDAVHPDNGCTAFHAACYGDSKFHIAGCSNHAECAEALARAGCDVSLKDNNGKTGQQRAEVQGSKEVARRLRYLARQPFVGVLVELAGLLGAAEYNGKRAMVRVTVFILAITHLYALCASKNHYISKRHVWQPNGGRVDRTVMPGAALPATEAALHSGAA